MAAAGDAALREAAEKAAGGGDAGGLALQYHRGHEMSGTTDLVVRDGREYGLRAVGRDGDVVHESAGTLGEPEVRRLWGAVARHALAVPSSTRPIGDGEVPTTIVVADAGHRARIEVWARDGRDIADFTSFQEELGGLLRDLTGGVVAR